MNNENVTQGRPHNIIMEGRSKLVISGVNEVDTFEEDNIQLKTSKGALTVRGSGMKLESYQAEIGDLVMFGNIYALVYVDDSTEKQGFFNRLFR